MPHPVLPMDVIIPGIKLLCTMTMHFERQNDVECVVLSRTEYSLFNGGSSGKLVSDWDSKADKFLLLSIVW